MEWRDAANRVRREARTLRLACEDPNTPWYAKWLAGGAHHEAGSQRYDG